MILLTRLNDKAFVLNAEQIKTIEETPDTVITLLNGDRIVVLEPPQEVVARAISYARQILGGRSVGFGGRSVGSGASSRCD